MLHEAGVPDMSPADLARERRIEMFRGYMMAATSERVRRIWQRAMDREIERRSEFARAEAARAALGEDGW